MTSLAQRIILCGAAWLALAARLPAEGRADDSNFRPYVVGSRAAGMGGAFTALADDGGGPYYNPGGIAFARRSSLSLSASVYGLVSGTFSDALGDGHNFNYQDLNTFPVSTSVIIKFGATDTPDGSPANAFALSAFVPDAFRIDDRDSIRSSQNAFFLSDEEQTVWAGLTYGRRFGRIGIGISSFVLIGSATTHLDLTAAPNMNEFATISERIDESTIGFVGAAGLRFDPSDHLRLGLSIYSPELGGGSRRAFVRVAVAPNMAGQPSQIVVVNADDLHTTPALPLRAQAGAAWTSGTFTISADAMFLAPRDVTDDADRAADGLDRHIVRNAVVNGSLGAELVAAGLVPIRAGFFTDFAASNEPLAQPPGTPNPNATNTSHVNRFGGTFSIGYKTEHTATDAGLILSYGSGKEVVPHNLNFQDLIPTTETQLYAYIFLASSYEF